MATFFFSSAYYYSIAYMNTLNFNEIDWEDIFLKLTAYAQNMINTYSKAWSRGMDKLPKGYEAKDFALETIKKFIENPSKFDPERNESLLNFLKFNILRRLVSNLAALSENKKLKDLIDQSNETLSSTGSQDSVFNETNVLTELFIIEKIDMDRIIVDIEQSIVGEDELQIVFNGLVYENSTRQEICQDWGLDPKLYDNALKRLKRKVDNILMKYR